MPSTPEPKQPKTTAAHRGLEVFIGDWHAEGTSYGDGQDAADPRAAGAPWTSDESYEWLPGKFFLLHRWDAMAGKREFKGAEVIGFDEAAGVAYAVQDGGTDWRTIKMLDVNNGKVGDELKWARFTSFAWATDGAGREGMPQKSKMATFAKNALCRRARNAGLNWRFTITTTVSKGVKQRLATIHHLPRRSSGSAV